jgi:hypothetical protein
VRAAVLALCRFTHPAQFVTRAAARVGLPLRSSRVVLFSLAYAVVRLVLEALIVEWAVGGPPCSTMNSVSNSLPRSAARDQGGLRVCWYGRDEFLRAHALTSVECALAVPCRRCCPPRVWTQAAHTKPT